MSAHLIPIRSERGFAQLPPIFGTYGGDVRTYESSAAIAPHVWLQAIDSNGEATIHLTAEDAWRLADQLRYLVRNHYQGDATPPWVHRAEGSS